MGILFFDAKDNELRRIIEGINTFELVGEKLDIALDRFFEKLNHNEKNYYISILEKKDISVLDNLIYLINQIRNIYDDLNIEPYEYKFGYVYINLRLMLFVDLCLQRCLKSIKDNAPFKEISYTYFSNWDDFHWDQVVAPFDEDCEQVKDFLSDLDIENATQSFLSNEEFAKEVITENSFIQDFIRNLKNVDLFQVQTILRSPEKQSFFYFEDNAYQDEPENRYALAAALYNELVGKYILKVSINSDEKFALSNCAERKGSQKIDDIIKPASKHNFYKNIEINALRNGSKKDVIICFKLMNHYGYFRRKLTLNELSALIKQQLGYEIDKDHMRKYGRKDFQDWLEEFNEIPNFLNL